MKEKKKNLINAVHWLSSARSLKFIFIPMWFFGFVCAGLVACRVNENQVAFSDAMQGIYSHQDCKKLTDVADETTILCHLTNDMLERAKSHDSYIELQQTRAANTKLPFIVKLDNLRNLNEATFAYAIEEMVIINELLNSERYGQLLGKEKAKGLIDKNNKLISLFKVTGEGTQEQIDNLFYYWLLLFVPVPLLYWLLMKLVAFVIHKKNKGK